MTSISAGPNYTPDNQISFIIQWFRTWSELQKDDFVEILAQKLSTGNNMNGLVNGMQKLDTDSRRVSLFSCQMKLFKEWWDSWSPSDKENLTSRLKDSDPKFWVTVEEELNGTRKKLEDDFFLTINSVENGSSSRQDNGECMTQNGNASENGTDNASNDVQVTDENTIPNGDQEESEEMEAVANGQSG